MSSADSGKEEVKKFRPARQLDAGLQRELAEALGDMSIEDILDAEAAGAAPQAKPLGQGVRRGTVIAVQGDDIFVDMGGPSEGLLPAEQFDDEPPPQVGEAIAVTIEGYDESNGLLVLSRKGAVRAATWETLEEGQVVEGRVTGHNAGGLEMDLKGIRAFMPISQIERFGVEDAAPYVGRRLRCTVIEIDRGDQNVVLSRRELLEVEAAEQREKLFESLAEGQVVSGVVRSIMPYGAFVDIGGADGLLHVRDMSYSRVEDPGSIVTEGQQVKVVVLNVDRDERKIALGLKQAMPDPWAGAEVQWPVNEIVTGRVTKLADFGAFVELAEGVEGLVHVSELAAGYVRSAAAIVQEGQTVRAKVLNVDEEARRISLSIKQALAAVGPLGEPAAETPEPPSTKRSKPLKGGLEPSDGPLFKMP